jgi:hypothetical protein
MNKQSDGMVCVSMVVMECKRHRQNSADVRTAEDRIRIHAGLVRNMAGHSESEKEVSADSITDVLAGVKLDPNLLFTAFENSASRVFVWPSLFWGNQFLNNSPRPAGLTK